MKDTIKTLAQKKLFWGVVVIIISQVLGVLPAADFLPPLWLKIVSFTLGIALTVVKGVEMFFEQSRQLEETSENYVTTDPITGAVETGTRIIKAPVTGTGDGTPKP